MNAITDMGEQGTRLKGRAAAERFVEILTGDAGASLFWRSLHDSEKQPGRNRHGSLADTWEAFETDQEEGFAPFAIINDGGHSDADISEVRACFIDVDGAPLDETEWHVPPHFIVRRAATHWHAYWLTTGLAVANFKTIQLRLAAHYDSDRAVCNPSRVMRLPGLKHLKDPATPHEVTLIDLTGGDALAVLNAALGVDEATAGLPELSDVAKSYRDAVRSDEGAVSANWRIVQEQISAIDPGVSYPEWRNVIWAVRDADMDANDDDRRAFLTKWSSGSTKFEDGRGPSVDALFYIPQKANVAPVTVRTIDTLARAHGYQGPSSHSASDQFGDLSVPGGDGGAALPAQKPEDLFVRNPSTGALSKTFPNALIAAKHMGAVPELDEFNHRVVFRGDVPWSEKYGRVLDDDLIRAIRVHFLSRWGLDVAKDHVSEAVLTVAASHRFHPVREYLNSLTWDGARRIDSWLIDHFGAPDTPYVRAVGRKTLTGAVDRALHPGCKFDNMLVLQGPQGIGKSTAIRKLASDTWFSDSLPGDLNKPDTVQALQGAWIIEMSELAGLSRSQVTTINAFISRQVDRARFAYDRLTKDYPRQCIFIGSTNESAYLRDPTGARRFWPVTVTRADTAAIVENRDQLWAESVAALRDGESAVLPRELWADAAVEQEERHAEDPWADELRTYLDGKGEPGPREPLDRVHGNTLLSAVLRIPKGSLTSNHATRLKAAMVNRLGWEYRRNLKIDGINCPGYVRPAVCELTKPDSSEVE